MLRRCLMLLCLVSACATPGFDEEEPARADLNAAVLSTDSAPLMLSRQEICRRQYFECLHYAMDEFDYCLCDNEYAQCLGRPQRACWPE